ncbi:MAG TPA: tetratricopeptide repeat protein [Treponemataceae bacterium]|nr:tetratricopeptide repeat protein [Treponemataceae bacterium]
MSHPLDSLVFITIPDEHHLNEAFPGFDSSIPLPVQLPTADAKFEITSLTREMILAGILSVFAYESDNRHVDYYRSLLLAIHPEIHLEMTEAAILKIKNGDFEIAEEIFRALRTLNPEDMLTVLNIALLMDERADSMRRAGLDDEADAFDAEAFTYYRIAMGAEPYIPEAFFNAGFFYLKQKNYKKAREVLESFLKIETGTEDVIKDRKAKAREIIEEISSRDLDDDLFKSAYDFITIGQEEKALEQIRLFMESHPKVWNAWFLLGWALRRLERWEDARAAFEQAVELGKHENSGIEAGYTDLCNELAICLMELGELDKSRACLISALEQESENTKIIANLGMLSLRKGNHDEADGFFRTVLEIDPNDKLAQEMLNRKRS